MLKIRQLIKRVRACRTAEEERSVINKESAEIRNLSKDPNAPFKARNLCKAIYMQMMGYQTSFMQMSCINLLASPDFTEKRIAYSALSLVIDSTSQVLLLATSTIKKDLQNKDNPDIQALALNAVGDVCTPDMCREISMEVANLISSAEDPNVKKKAACAAVVIIKNCPETIDSFVHNLQNIYLKEDVDDYIENVLKKLYNVELKEVVMFTKNGNYDTTGFDKYFLESGKIDVIHLILINDYCEKSKKYNYNAIQFSKGTIHHETGRTPFPILVSFILTEQSSPAEMKQLSKF